MFHVTNVTGRREEYSLSHTHRLTSYKRSCLNIMDLLKYCAIYILYVVCAMNCCSAMLMPGDHHTRMEGTKCNIHKPTENCDQREIKYVLRMKGDTKEGRFEKYKSLFDLTHVDIHEHNREDHTYDGTFKHCTIYFIVAII